MSTLTFKQVKERIEVDSLGKADYITPINNLCMDNDGKIIFKDLLKIKGSTPIDISLRPTDWANGQIFSKLKMPTRYFKKLSIASPELTAQHFNYWAEKEGNYPVMLRTKINGDSGVIRGFVSEKFSRLDNNTMIDSLEEILKKKKGSYRIQDFFMDEKRVHLRLVCFDGTKTFTLAGMTASGEEDYLQVGLDIVNSEVGASSLNIVPVVFRLVCSNGLRRWSADGDVFNQRHIYLKENEFQDKMEIAMADGIKIGQGLLKQHIALKSIEVENPLDVIGEITKAGEFSKEFHRAMVYEFEYDNTAYGIVNAVTAAAKRLPDERRLEAEKYAGKLVSLPLSGWEAFEGSIPV